MVGSGERVDEPTTRHACENSTYLETEPEGAEGTKGKGYKGIRIKQWSFHYEYRTFWGLGYAFGFLFLISSEPRSNGNEIGNKCLSNSPTLTIKLLSIKLNRFQTRFVIKLAPPDHRLETDLITNWFIIVSQLMSQRVTHK